MVRWRCFRGTLETDSGQLETDGGTLENVGGLMEADGGILEVLWRLRDVEAGD